MQQTVADDFAQDELAYATKMVLHGSVKECPTQTLNDMVLIYNACCEPTDLR